MGKGGTCGQLLGKIDFTTPNCIDDTFTFKSISTAKVQQRGNPNRRAALKFVLATLVGGSNSTYCVLLPGFMVFIVREKIQAFVTLLVDPKVHGFWGCSGKAKANGAGSTSRKPPTRSAAVLH